MKAKGFDIYLVKFGLITGKPALLGGFLVRDRKSGFGE